MRKVMATLLAVAFAAAGSRTAVAADSSGIGLEWAFTPTISMAGFDTDLSGQEFTLGWKVSDSFSVGVFSGSGRYEGEVEYTNTSGFQADAVPTVVAPNVKHKRTVEGGLSTSGIRIMTKIPVLNILSAGLEAGAVTVGVSTAVDTLSDGSANAPGAANFGGAGGVAAARNIGFVGVVAKATLLKATTSTVTTMVSVAGALRFASTNDVAVFGTQEVNTNLATKDAIDPVTSFNTLAVSISLGLMF